MRNACVRLILFAWSEYFQTSLERNEETLNNLDQLVVAYLLFLDLVQSALRYNETSNIYLGNNGVELSIVDKLYFYNKETLIDFDNSFKIKRLKLKDDFSIRTTFKLHIQLSLLLRSEQKLLFL